MEITITEYLQCATHINTTAAYKLAKSMSYSYVNLKHCPQELKELAYFSLGQSILEYASIVWDLYLQRLFRTIENVHQRAARYVTKV